MSEKTGPSNGGESGARDKRASTSTPILPVLAERWSPYVLDPRPMNREHLVTVLEAARWAASSYNEQPWRFLVAVREDAAEFSRAVDCLMEANQAWARNASALLFTVVSRTFARNGSPNRVAEHDLGLAMGNLCAQATALGIVVHQMGGVNLTKVRLAYQIPEGFDPVTAVALGYLGDAATADEELVKRDAQPRVRRPLSETVFAGKWGQTSPII